MRLYCATGNIFGVFYYKWEDDVAQISAEKQNFGLGQDSAMVLSVSLQM